MNTNNDNTDRNQDRTSEIVPDINAAALLELARTIKEVKYGVVQVIIQDGHVVQIEKTEKIRLK